MPKSLSAIDRARHDAAVAKVRAAQTAYRRVVQELDVLTRKQRAKRNKYLSMSRAARDARRAMQQSRP